MSAKTFSITPETALIDENVRITLSGFSSNLRLTIRACASDDLSRRWESRATFITDSNGNVDVSLQCPAIGTYHDADSMGLFWSMSPVLPVKKGEATFFVKKQLELPTIITFDVLVDEEIVASTQVTRLHMSSGITAISLTEDGLTGTLYEPATAGLHPALLVLCGSDGSIRSQAAALLASYGYAALALVYFGSKGVPAKLANIPLEYFETAISWLQKRPDINRDQIGVIGTSRGAELALLLGATFPEVKVVIASAPSIYVHGAVGYNSKTAGWTYKGQPLPHIVAKPGLRTIADFLWQLMRRKPVANRPMFVTEFTQSKQIRERATIPVEKIQGAVLLLSGEDDQLWPSTIYVDMIMERLQQHNFPHIYQHVHYSGAGHLLGVPYSFPNLPPVIEPQPALGMLLAFGGNAKDSAFAAADSWRHIRTFLAESFGKTDTSTQQAPTVES